MSPPKPPIRLNDPTLRDAAARLDTFTSMLRKRLDEVAAGSGRVDKTTALLEAEVAAGLVESAIYEVALRLLGHGVQVDSSKEIDKRLARYRLALAAFESSFGPIPRA